MVLRWAVYLTLASLSAKCVTCSLVVDARMVVPELYSPPPLKALL